MIINLISVIRKIVYLLVYAAFVAGVPALSLFSLGSLFLSSLLLAGAVAVAALAIRIVELFVMYRYKILMSPDDMKERRLTISDVVVVALALSSIVAVMIYPELLLLPLAALTAAGEAISAIISWLRF